MPKDLSILPRLDDRAPFSIQPAVAAIVKEQADLARELSSSLKGFDPQREKAIEAEWTLIRRLERQAAAADRREAEAKAEAANYRQEAEEARRRLAYLMRPAYSVGVVATTDDPTPAPLEPSTPTKPVSAKPVATIDFDGDHGPAIELVLRFFEHNPCSHLSASRILTKMNLWLTTEKQPTPSPSSVLRARQIHRSRSSASAASTASAASVTSA